MFPHTNPAILIEPNETWVSLRTWIKMTAPILVFTSLESIRKSQNDKKRARAPTHWMKITIFFALFQYSFFNCGNLVLTIIYTYANLRIFTGYELTELMKLER